MGGGRGFKYPKWVWSPAGGWWVKPVGMNRNTGLFLALFAFPIAALSYSIGENNTTRYAAGVGSSKGGPLSNGKPSMT